MTNRTDHAMAVDDSYSSTLVEFEHSWRSYFIPQFGACSLDKDRVQEIALDAAFRLRDACHGAYEHGDFEDQALSRESFLAKFFDLMKFVDLIKAYAHVPESLDAVRDCVMEWCSAIDSAFRGEGLVDEDPAAHGGSDDGLLAGASTGLTSAPWRLTVTPGARWRYSSQR